MEKRVLVVFVCLILVLCGLAGCGDSHKGQDKQTGSADGGSTYTEITAEEAKEMMESTKEYVLLDVRTEEEYAEAHIDGALLIPDYEIGELALDEIEDKTIPILVYCRSGRRSAGASAELVDMGYTAVYDMGGIIDWPYGTVGE